MSALARARRRTGQLGLALIWRLPRRAVYWSLIRAWSHASAGPWSGESPLGLRFEDVLDRWGTQYVGQPSDPRGTRQLAAPPLARTRWGETLRYLELLNRELPAGQGIDELGLYRLAGDLDMDALILVKRLRAAVIEGIPLADIITEARTMRARTR